MAEPRRTSIPVLHTRGTHYEVGYDIVRYTLWQKSDFCPKNQFWRFWPNFFLTIFFDNFLVNSKLSTAKKSKTTTFSRVFHPKKIDNFLGKSKLNFWTKNEDFEQCVKRNCHVTKCSSWDLKEPHRKNRQSSSSKKLACNFSYQKQLSGQVALWWI